MQVQVQVVAERNAPLPIPVPSSLSRLPALRFNCHLIFLGGRLARVMQSKNLGADLF